MGLAWGNYLISVGWRRAQLQPLGLESDRETKRAGKHDEVEGKQATEGSAEVALPRRDLDPDGK